MKTRILIVDDDANIRDLLRNRLEANGYEVISADNGLDGLRTIKSVRPDLVITDVYMPHLDGLTFFQELQSDDELRSIPLLVITGVKSMRDVFEPTRMAKFLPKPFEGKELLASVEECMNY